jgi:cephalosporin hydroxylase
MNPHEQFESEVRRNVDGLKADRDVQALSRIWMREITPHRYAYNFRWMGRPIIQFPQDMVAMQEIVWSVRPDLIIETGIAHGGSVLYYASLLELAGHGEVIGIDVDIRAANREAIEAHPMSRRLRMIEGSSVAPDVVEQVRSLARGRRAIVVLDSNHTHEHVLDELRAYAPLVCEGGYCVVMDTLIEDMPARFFESGDRPWRVGDNPKTAVREYLREDRRFEVDEDLEAKLLMTVAPGGWLKRVR